MKTFTFNLVLDDWKISTGYCKGKNSKDARAKLYARLRKRGFRKTRGEVKEVLFHP